MIPISQKKIKQTIKFYKEGLSVKKISKRLGLGKTTIRRYLHQSRITLVDKRHLTDKQINKAIELYKKGLWPYEIASLINYNSTQAIARAIRQAGISRGYHYRFTEKDKDNIVKDYSGGMSGVQIQNKYKMTSRSVYDILIENGTAIRSNKEAKRIYSVNHDFFNKINSDNVASWLGMLMADGDIGYRKGCSTRITLRLSTKDKDYLKKFVRDLEATYPINDTIQIKKNKNYPMSTIGITSEQMGKDLARYGVVPNKTFKVKYPDIPKQLNSALIRGIFDGDGCISASYPERGYSALNFSICSNRNIVLAIRKILVETLGISSTKIYRIKRKRNIYVYQKGDKEVFKIMEWLYKDATVWMDRKRDRYEHIKKVYLGYRGLTSIEELFNGSYNSHQRKQLITC